MNMPVGVATCRGPACSFVTVDAIRTSRVKAASNQRHNASQHCTDRMTASFLSARKEKFQLLEVFSCHVVFSHAEHDGDRRGPHGAEEVPAGSPGQFILFIQPRALTGAAQALEEALRERPNDWSLLVVRGNAFAAAKHAKVGQS